MEAENHHRVTREEILQRVRGGDVIAMSKEWLAPLLESAETVREDRTSIAGLIRTFRLGDLVLVQERNQKGDYFLRSVVSEVVAERFVEERLAAYERMWDG